MPSAILFDKWVRQYGALSWNTGNSLPIKLKRFRIDLFKRGTDLHIWSDAKITSSKWQKKMLAGGMRRNICREWRKYFAKMQQIHRSQQSEKLLTVNLEKNRQMPAHNCWQWTWESERHISSRGGRVTLECNKCERLYNHVRQTRAHPDATGPQWWWKGNGGR